MRQTLFYLPHEIAGIPFLGVGWLLAIWLLVAAVMIWTLWKQHGWSSETIWQIPVVVVVAAAIVFVLPHIEEKLPLPDQPPENWPVLGLPIRGYGVMVLLAVIAGVGLAVYRAKRIGLDADTIFGLAFAMFLAGIVGARLFYVIQYWNEIHVPGNVAATAAAIVNLVQGGLVVYGSLIGAIVGFVVYTRKHHLPSLAIADLIAPSMALGLAIGRIGCLLNGCCFGGVCDSGAPSHWAITFPDGSPPYIHQKGLGMLHGFRLTESENGVSIAEIADASLIETTSLRVGQQVIAIDGHPVRTLHDAQNLLLRAGGLVSVTTNVGTIQLDRRPLPVRSLPIHPTQVYSSINALLICLLGLAIYPYRRKDGQVIATVLTAYALTRFLLEIIRTDESSFFSTGLTISQNVSVVMLIALAALWCYVSFRQSEPAFPVSAKA